MSFRPRGRPIPLIPSLWGVATTPVGRCRHTLDMQKNGYLRELIRRESLPAALDPPSRLSPVDSREVRSQEFLSNSRNVLNSLTFGDTALHLGAGKRYNR